MRLILFLTFWQKKPGLSEKQGAKHMAVFSEKELYVTFCVLISGGKKDKNSCHANQ